MINKKTKHFEYPNLDCNSFVANQLATHLGMMHYCACHLFCSYQYSGMHRGYKPRDIYF